jgi:hypothetical protein
MRGKLTVLYQIAPVISSAKIDNFRSGHGAPIHPLWPQAVLPKYNPVTNLTLQPNLSHLQSI